MAYNILFRIDSMSTFSNSFFFYNSSIFIYKNFFFSVYALS